MCKTKSVYLKKEVKEILKTKDNQNGYINNAIALYSCLEKTINPVLLQAFISDQSQFEINLNLFYEKPIVSRDTNNQITTLNLEEKTEKRRTDENEILKNLNNLKI